MAIQNDGGGKASGKSWSGGAGRRQPTAPARSNGRVSGTATPSAPAPAPAPAPSGGGGYSGGGYSGGGGGGFAAAAAPPPVAAPAPMRDVDWFNSDSIYRGQAGKALTDLTSQLAQILADRDSGYMQLDNARGDLGRNRQEDLTALGDDFSGRGLLSSGLYAQRDDQMAADYARQGSALDESANQLAQQYGKRDSMVDLNGLRSGNAPADLSSIYGLLGAMGVGAGNNYNSALGKARGESAARATGPLVNTLGW